jgi:DNA-binding CsgD family transcriptional regulator
MNGEHWAAYRTAQLEAASAASFEELVESGIAALTASFDGSVGCLYERRGEELSGYMPRGLPNFFGNYSREFMKDDPVQEIKRTLRAPVAVTTELVSRRALRRSSAYHEVYRPCDLEHAVAARVLGDSFVSDQSVVLMIGRGRGQPAFGNHEITLLSKILPLYTVAVRRLQRTRALARRLFALEAIVAQDVRSAVVVYDDQGRLVFRSSRAAEWLGGEVDAPAAQVQLHARRIAAALVEPAPSETPPLAQEILDIRGVRCVVRYRRQLDGDQRVHVIAEVERHPSAVASMFAREYGLTAAEMHVLAALDEGSSNAELARRMSLSIQTVRAHLRSIFAKLEVTSRLQAVVELRDYLNHRAE